MQLIENSTVSIQKILFSYLCLDLYTLDMFVSTILFDIFLKILTKSLKQCENVIMLIFGYKNKKGKNCPSY